MKVAKMETDASPTSGEPTLRLLLPMPPGVNNLYMPVRSGKYKAKFIKSDAARRWASQARYSVEEQRAGVQLPKRFRVSIFIAESNFDSDAPIKELLDACQHGGAITNDKHCRGGTWDVDDTLAPGCVVVELFAIDG